MNYEYLYLQSPRKAVMWQNPKSKLLISVDEEKGQEKRKKKLSDLLKFMHNRNFMTSEFVWLVQLKNISGVQQSAESSCGNC